MAETPVATVTDHFSGLEDPGGDNRSHLLLDIIVHFHPSHGPIITMPFFSQPLVALLMSTAFRYRFFGPM